MDGRQHGIDISSSCVCALNDDYWNSDKLLACRFVASPHHFLWKVPVMLLIGITHSCIAWVWEVHHFPSVVHLGKNPFPSFPCVVLANIKRQPLVKQWLLTYCRSADGISAFLVCSRSVNTGKEFRTSVEEIDLSNYPLQWNWWTWSNISKLIASIDRKKAYRVIDLTFSSVMALCSCLGIFNHRSSPISQLKGELLISNAYIVYKKLFAYILENWIELYNKTSYGVQVMCFKYFNI